MCVQPSVKHGKSLNFSVAAAAFLCSKKFLNLNFLIAIRIVGLISDEITTFIYEKSFSLFSSNRWRFFINKSRSFHQIKILL
jgi:hypothetical protein